MRELAVHGMPERYLHTSLGYNSRLDAIQAAVLNVKLPRLEEWIGKRTAIAKRYRDALGDLNGLTLPTADDGHSWNQFVVRIGSCPSGQPLCNASCNPSSTSARHGIPESCCRDWVKQTLQERGVSTIIYYPIPIHRQPAYAHLGLKQGSLPITEQLCSQVLSLPIFPELTVDQQQAVIDTVRQCFRPVQRFGVLGEMAIHLLPRKQGSIQEINSPLWSWAIKPKPLICG